MNFSCRERLRPPARGESTGRSIFFVAPIAPAGQFFSWHRSPRLRVTHGGADESHSAFAASRTLRFLRLRLCAILFERKRSGPQTQPSGRRSLAEPWDLHNNQALWLAL